MTFDLSFYVKRENIGHFLARVCQDFETEGMKKERKTLKSSHLHINEFKSLIERMDNKRVELK